MIQDKVEGYDVQMVSSYPRWEWLVHYRKRSNIAMRKYRSKGFGFH